MSHPTYQIAALSDFRKVPEDRLAACLTEFADWLEITRRADALLRSLAPDHPADQPILADELFVWIDDGARNVDMRLTAKDGEPDLIHVSWPESGETTVTVKGKPMENPDAR
jgi:hypothetical protein